jgi:magnesium chelatase family protein
MKLKSLIENSNRLEVAEVEIEFIPGIPQIHFLGLPDRIIKESFYRIKSALKNAGYKFPLTNQIIVNIKPHHLRKSSRGLELAVALGILLRSEQIPPDKISEDWILYGELGLDGNIFEPTDLRQNLYVLKGQKIVTGNEVGCGGSLDTQIMRLSDLKSLELTINERNHFYSRPQFGLNLQFSEEEAELLFLAATSGLHTLLAGDSGAGKSTLGRALNSFLGHPGDDENVRLERNWRPVVSPHQSITPAAFLGGSAAIYEGEIERSEGGILLLDELLVFDPYILEALRGPMTGDTLRLARGAAHREISSRFQVVATTNLCPCGKWSPIKKNITCRFTRAKCTRYLEKFSGPLLDRFGLLVYKTSRQVRKISGSKVLERTESFREFSAKTGKLKYEVCGLAETHYGYLSARRRNYLLKVAAIYAIEEIMKQRSCVKNQLKIEMRHLNQAEKCVIRPFEQLEKGMG